MRPAAFADPLETWRHAIETLGAAGWRIGEEPPPPGTWRRIPALGKTDRNRSAAVTIAADGAAVHLVDHANDIRETVQARRPASRDPAERRARADDFARRRAEQEKARAVARSKAIAHALGQYIAAGPGDGHRHVVGKELRSAYGARQVDDTLLVLGRDADGQPAFVQRIIGDGRRKLIARGTSFVGAFVTFGTPTPDGTLVIATGWATSAVLFEEAGHPTLAAMADGNLERVARIARGRYPDADIVIAGDDDRGKVSNSGRKAATAAARAVGARLAFPVFCDGCDGSCSDFADTRACERRRAGAVR